jgi:hypothetical protein
MFYVIFIAPCFGATFAQYPDAVEQWSEPVKVDSLSNIFTWESSPSLTQNSDTIYLYINDAIYTSFLKDKKWQTPVRLNSNVNNGTPIRNPSISKDSKRLYYSRWGGYGGWNMWYSVRDSSTNDWGASINMGANLNQNGGVFYAYELSPDTLYVVNNVWAEMGVCIYVKNKSTLDWNIIDSSNYHHLFGTGDIRGISITADRKKAYFSYYDFKSADSLQSDLYVTYWDTLNHRWGNCYKLNINSKAFKPDPNNDFNWIGGWDEYPWISPDGKTLYFTSNRDVARSDTVSYPDIYMSKLIVDENGNPVTSIKQTTKTIIDDFKLCQNYPNPFNPSTTISYQLPKDSKVSLKIYNMLGQEIMTLVNGNMEAGTHSVTFNASKLASGVYLYKLDAGTYSQSKKMILTK